MLPTTRPLVDVTDRLRTAAARFMQIDDTTFGEGADYQVRFRGRLLMDSRQAYAQAAESFRELGYTPLFRKEGDTHVVLAVAGAPVPRPSRIWINYVMFGVTFLSVILSCATYGVPPTPTTAGGWLAFFAGGVPFAIALLC